MIERVAGDGDPTAIPFPLAHMTDHAPDFSFSGIKTAVSLYVKRHGPLAAAGIADVAASFQASVVTMLVRKTLRAAEQLSVDRVVLTGGVAANSALRARLAAASAERGIRLHIPPRNLCTDNAAMITAAGTARLLAGERADLALNAEPDLSLADRTASRPIAAARDAMRVPRGR
jgi:N6-L-threonylcarbamoyladenine synthase